jgi:hypothetical protein
LAAAFWGAESWVAASLEDASFELDMAAYFVDVFKAMDTGTEAQCDCSLGDLICV